MTTRRKVAFLEWSLQRRCATTARLVGRERTTSAGVGTPWGFQGARLAAPWDCPFFSRSKLGVIPILSV